MVSSLSCRHGAVEVGLNGVVAHSADSHHAALHLEILIAADAVAYCRSDVEGEVLHGDIITALDGMLGFSHHIKHTVSLQLDLSLAVDARLLRAVGTIGKSVLCILFRADLNTFAVGYTDSSIGGTGKADSCQRHRTFVRAGEGKLSVGRRS